MKNIFDENKKLYKSQRNASILFGIILTGVGLGVTAFFGPRSQMLTYISFALTMVSLFVGIALAFSYHKNVYKGDKRQHRPLLISIIFVGIVLPIYFFFQWLDFRGGELAIIVGCFMVALLLRFIYKNKLQILKMQKSGEQNADQSITQAPKTDKGEIDLKKQGLKLPCLAVGMEVASIGLLLLVFNGISFPVPGAVGLLIVCSALIAPFVGIILGFHCLFTPREEGGSSERRALSLISILFPFVCVALVILLAVHGIWVIRFM